MKRFRKSAIVLTLMACAAFGAFAVQRVAEASSVFGGGGAVFAFFGLAGTASTESAEQPPRPLLIAPCVAGEKTWDGEGATNNWSEPANWTCDAVPAGFDIVKFDATSTKNAVVNLASQAITLRVDAAYTGTISIADGVSFTIGRTTSGGLFTQSFGGGALACGTGSQLTVGRGTMTMTGGAIDCRNGTTILDNATLRINGGTFDAPSGLFRFLFASIERTGGGVFNHNGGTIRIEQLSSFGSADLGDTQTFTLNNLTILGETSLQTNDTVTVLGDLDCQTNCRFNGANNSNWELRGNVTIGAGFLSGGVSTVTIAGDADQIYTNATTINPTGTWRINKSSGKLVLASDFQNFGNLDLAQGVIDAGVFTVFPGPTSGSRITGGGPTSYVIGKFRCDLVGFGTPVPCHVGTASGYSPATLNFSSSGGVIVEATEGVQSLMNPNQAIARKWNLTPVGSPNYSVTFRYLQSDVIGDEAQFFGAAINGAAITFGGAVNGSLNEFSFTGQSNALVYTAGSTTGVCQIGQKTWDGGGVTNNWSESANWTCNQTPLATDRVIFDTTSNKNATIDVASATVRSVEIVGYNGTVTNASTTFTVQESSSLGLFRQTSGTFNGGAGTINLNLGGSAVNSGLRLTGGNFISTAGTLNLDSFAGSVIDSGANFFANDGTVVILGAMNGGTNIGGTKTDIGFNNLDIRANANFQGTLAAYARKFSVAGLLTMGGNTGFGAILFQAGRDVTVAANSVGGASRLVLTGGGNQTISNLGGVFPFQQITVDKSTGKVTATTPLALRADFDDLIIQNGTLELASGSGVTARSINVGPNGKLVGTANGTLTIGDGGVVNNGIVDLNGNGTVCNEVPSNPISIVSSDAVAARPWTGTGINRLIDVTVARMSGADTPKTVFSGTDGGGNDASWTFDANCRPPMTISPIFPDLVTGQTQSFTTLNAFGTVRFRLSSNPSGGSIDPSTGVYTAGTVGRVSDTVVATDQLGQVAVAIVHVYYQPAALVFTQQPTSTIAGQQIAPAVKVLLLDADGFLAGISDVQVQLAVAGSSGAILNGSTTKSTVSGMATFDDLNMTQAGTYQLTATSGSLPPQQSSFFNILATSPVGLAISQQPSNTFGNAPNLPGVGVQIVDAFGNRVFNAQVPVTVAIGNNPAGGTLTGTLTRTSQNGNVVFSDLSIDNEGVGYTLEASSPGLTSTTTSPFDIVPIVVTNTNDSGDGSLRAAIIWANGLGGRQRITFDIPGAGPHKIAPLSPLPFIADAAELDATSQPGYAGTPLIELSGENAPGATGIGVVADDVTVKGFAINRFNRGVLSSGRNFSFAFNHVGTDPSGTIARPNVSGGVEIYGDNTTVANNLISGNTGYGINFSLLSTATAHESSIVRNRIGTQVDGATPLPNRGAGILITQQRTGSELLPIYLNIGGAEADGNVIAFNAPTGGAGIVHRAALVSARIRRNRIFDNGSNTFKRAIQFGSLTRSTNNDSRDPDSGFNALQNYPTVTRVVSGNGITVITGTLNSRPNTSYDIDFFARPVCFTSDGVRSDGELFVDSTTAPVVTNNNGFASFTFTTTRPVQIGKHISATASAADDRGATSEYFPCSFNTGGTEVVGARFEVGGQIVDQSGNPLPFVRVFIAGTTISTLTDSNGRYSFPDLPAGFDYTIGFSAPGYQPQPATRVIVNLQSNQLNEDFAAIRLGSISGRVMSRTEGATVPLPDATVTLDGVGSVTSDVNGRYRFNNLPAGAYTVSVAKPNFSFAPSTVNTTLDRDRVVDFTGVFFSVSNLFGRVMTGAPTLPIMNADGSASMQVFAVSAGFGSAPTDGQLSPNGRLIVFTQRSGGNQTFTQYKLRVANFDGSGIVDISEPTSNQLVTELNPTWSNNRTKIVYTRGTISGTVLSIVNSDGSGRVQLSATAGLSPREADFSPDGDTIVFSGQNPSAPGLYRINSDGSGLTRLTNGTFDAGPRFSADGAKILFIRRQTSFVANGGRLLTMNPDGTNVTELPTPLVDQVESADWSPHGPVIMFREQGLIKAILADGSATVTVTTARSGGALTWSVTPNAGIATGTNETSTVGPISVTFAGVSSSGALGVTQIPAGSAGTLPPGFAIANQAGNLAAAYEISATSGAVVSPPITVCFTLSVDLPLATFNAYSILHNEGGVLVDRTVSRDFATKQVCAQTTSLSPFVIGEQIDSGRPSIAGLVVDQSGAPMAGVSVALTGSTDLDTTTDSDGRFRFVNLVPNGDYNVRPASLGVVFADPSRDFVGITGETVVVFTGTAQTFSISGTVTDAVGGPLAGATVTVAGSESGSVTTDTNGNYTFTGLPADGFFELSAARTGVVFPNSQIVDPLTGDASGVDFAAFVPTAAGGFVAGRVMTANGSGIRNATVTITDTTTGETRSVRTGTFGIYRFDALETGRNYVVTVSANRYRFANNSHVISLSDNVADADFIADQQ